MHDRRGRGFGKHLSKRMWLLLGLLALLPGMAFLQYRWIGQVSDAARERAKTRLQNSVEQLVTEFDAEITRAHMAFWTIPGSESEGAAERFTDRYREWHRLAPYPQLIREAYVIDTTGDAWQLSRIDSLGEVKRLPEWPSELEKVRRVLEESGQSGSPGFWRRGGDDLTIGGNPAFLAPLRELRTDDERSRELRHGRCAATWPLGTRRGPAWSVGRWCRLTAPISSVSFYQN